MPFPESAVRLLRQAVDDGVAPAIAATVVRFDGEPDVVAVGRRRIGGLGVTVDTRFDLASLTKVVATLPSVLRLVAEGEVALDDPVGRFFSSAGWFQQPSLADVTVRALLTHTSGLPAWRPLFAQVGARSTARAAVLQSPLERPGDLVYSAWAPGGSTANCIRVAN